MSSVCQRDCDLWCCLEHKVFLTIGSKHSPLPTWIINTDIDEMCPWKAVSTELVLPAFCPAALRQFSCVWTVLGDQQPLLESGVREGVWMSKEQLVKLHAALKFPLPGPKQGSGASGNLVKVDYAQGLVKWLLAASSAEEQQKAVDSLMGHSQVHVECPSEVLEALKKIDPDSQPEFKWMMDVIKNQESSEDANRSRSSAAYPGMYERKNFTPPEIKQLLPLQGASGIICNRNPVLKRYQAFFPRALLTTGS